MNAGIPNSDAQSLYEQGYGSILQRDYGAAETAFRQLIAAYPNDPLAGSAQYWIGESYYVRGQYKSAADAFLKGYKKYKSGDKAPDTLLKLGMSLAELGQKDAACSTFGELTAKYPQAPGAHPRPGQGRAQKGRLLTWTPPPFRQRRRKLRSPGSKPIRGLRSPSPADPTVSR